MDTVKYQRKDAGVGLLAIVHSNSHVLNHRQSNSVNSMETEGAVEGSQHAVLIIRREIVHNILSFRFMITHALLFCLVLLSVYLMTNDYQSRFQIYETQVTEERDRIAAVAGIVTVHVPA